jgi:uncharacterized membrane protein YhaH (DUF805 family)
MLGAVFSYRGRLNRIQYFLAIMGLGLGAAVVAVVAIVVAFGGQPPDRASVMRAGLGLIPVALIAVPVFYWISFSLQARRFRDIGWEPVFVIPAWLICDVIDRVAIMGAPQFAVSPSAGVSWLGLLVNLGLGLCLLFWPGRTFEDVAAVFDDVPPQPSRAQANAPAPAAQPATPWSPSSTATGFGRRGL